jgi:hypothetical protein
MLLPGKPVKYFFHFLMAISFSMASTKEKTSTRQHVWEAEAPWQTEEDRNPLLLASRYWDSVEHTALCKNGLGRIRHLTRVYGSAPRGKEKKNDAMKEFEKIEAIIAMRERIKGDCSGRRGSR